MEITQTIQFENDLLKIKNLVHPVKSMNTSNQGIIEEIEKDTKESKNISYLKFEELMDNSFAMNELLDIITEMKYSERFEGYVESISKAENNKC